MAYKFLIEGNERIAFDLDFSTPKAAVESALEQIADKRLTDIVKDKTGKSRINAILDYVAKEVITNIKGFAVDEYLALWRDNDWSLEKKNKAFQDAAIVNPSIGVMLSAYKKKFGEVSSSTPLRTNFPQLDEEQIKRIETIQTEISTINRDQAFDEKARINSGIGVVKDMSKADRDRWYAEYDAKRARVVNGFMPYLILNLNFTHLPQRFRNEEFKAMSTLLKSQDYIRADESKKTEMQREVKRSSLVKFKVEELNKWKNNPQYELPKKQSA